MQTNIDRTVKFTPPWDDSPIDISFVFENEMPAGKHGFLTCKDGKMVFEDGVEAKFYSDRVEVDNNFETSIKNLYVGGDGAGITRGLAQAGANGVKIARSIKEK